jgi:outer membrane receptor protein involved in Fe transport
MESMTAKRLRGAFKLSSAILAASLVQAQAFAQTAPEPTKEPAPAVAASDTTVADIIVTGSRVDRAGFSAPTPVTVVGASMLVDRSPSVLIDVIKLLPAARNTSTPTTASQTIGGTGGGSFINLRGLGANRTLVLLNGQRMIPTSNIGTVDIAILPQSLVKRIDIVTGGASAAYGSDAVAGVANLVLDTDLSGVRANVEGGVSSRGDGGSRKASLGWGGNLGDRFHVVLGGEYYHANAIPATARNSRFYTTGTVANPNFTATNGQKSLIVAPYVYLNNMTLGGLILGGPLANTQFLPGGATAAYAPCGPVAGTSQVCSQQRNDLTMFQRAVDLTSAQSRYSAYANLGYELSDRITLRADALYGESKTHFHSVPPATAVLGAYTIRRDNAYLPAAVAARMDAAGVTSFSLGRYSEEFGNTAFTRFTNVKRGSFAADVDLGHSWKANAYTAYSASNYNWRYENAPIPDLFNQGVDAVINPANGQIVCRSTLTVPGNGCIPINLFGVGAPNVAAKSFAYGTALTFLHSREFAAGGSISGEPFSTWAGPVSIVVGAEYRWDNAKQTVDPIQLARRFAYNNQLPLDGTIKVKEAYAETVVPLAKDMAFAKLLELNGAVRVTDYSTSGTVTTWKLGGNYEPLDGLRFRVVRSRDIRAPNILELNSKSVVVGSATTAIDPRTNTLAQFPSFTSGNPFLKPEIANTFSAGVVFRPHFLPRFNVSFDYYRIKITNSIQTLSVQQTLNECQAGNVTICSFITRDANGVLTSVTTPYANIAKNTTSGFDLETSYQFDVGSGTVDLRALGNYLREYVIDLGTSKIDYAGDISVYSIPKWGWDFGATYRNGGTSLNVDARYVGSGKYSVASAALIENNKIPSVWYFDAGAEQKFKTSYGELTLYIRGENIFDQKPPKLFPVAGGNYDRVGPYVKVGARIKI